MKCKERENSSIGSFGKRLCLDDSVKILSSCPRATPYIGIFPLF